jgi:hypothetical protein
MAASWPISFHVGATAVRRMSAASSNPSAKASQRPSSRRTCSWPAAGVRGGIRPRRRADSEEQEQRAHDGFGRGHCDHDGRGRLDAVRQVECQLLEKRFNHVFDLARAGVPTRGAAVFSSSTARRRWPRRSEIHSSVTSQSSAASPTRLEGHRQPAEALIG